MKPAPRLLTEDALGLSEQDAWVFHVRDCAAHSFGSCYEPFDDWRAHEAIRADDDHRLMQIFENVAVLGFAAWYWWDPWE